MKEAPELPAPAQRGGVALMYHSISPGSGTAVWPWAVSVSRFCEQLDRLAALGYTTLTLQELLARGPACGRAVAITFDDGYADNLVAANELVKRNMRASWYVVTGSVGRDPRWQDDGRPKGALLTARDLRDLQAAGMEIGSHGCSHLHLPQLDDATLATELRDSRAMLEDLLGAPVGGFAYPYGDRDPRCGEAVRAAGYRYALTTDTGWALLDADPYQVRRLTIFNHDTVGRFQRKLAFGSHDVDRRHMIGYWARRLGARLKGRR